MNPAIWDVTRALPGSPLMPLSAFSSFVDGLDHPEGVACGPDGGIYAGGEAGQVYRVSDDGVATEIGSTGGFALGLCLDAEENVYVCDVKRHAVMRMTPAGSVSVHSSGSAARPMVTPNYPVFDAAGNLYVSDSGSWHGNDGCIFRIAPDGATEVFIESDAVAAFPNGLALNPAGTHLSVVVSQLPGVVRVAIEADGMAGVVETVVELPHNVPDGLAFDEAGDLYITCYAPAVIYRVSPGGEVAIVVTDWESTTLATPTNIAFCGGDRKTLVVASLSRWHLARGAMPVAGARLNHPTMLGGG